MQTAWNRLTSADHNGPDDFPHADALAALRAWYAGLSTCEAVARYLRDGHQGGQGSQPVGTFSRARAVDPRRAVPLADRTALCARRPVRRREGQGRHQDTGSRCVTRIHGRRMAAGLGDRRRTRMVVWLVSTRRPKAPFSARFRFCNRLAGQRTGRGNA